MATAAAMLVPDGRCGSSTDPTVSQEGEGEADNRKFGADLIEQMGIAVNAGVGAVEELGGGRKGDCTMLDALIPISPALLTLAATCRLREGHGGEEEGEGRRGEEGATNNNILLEAAKVVARAAREGAESTKAMVAQRGRSSYLRTEDVRGRMDPGARAVVIWAQAIEEALRRHVAVEEGGK